MSNDPKQEAAERQHRFREACALQEIEGNPLTPEEIAMFEMFRREGWSDERRRAYLADLAKNLAADIAAE
ncbi:MAG: hypothetical protein ACKVRO_15385 [Micropepsaceae bacterium]